MHPSQPTFRQTICDSERIQQFLESGHFRIEDDDLISHLDHCPQCRRELESRAGDADVWNRATTLLKPNEFDHASSAMYSAAGTTNQPRQQPFAIQDALNCLAPTDDPHHLGRLGTYEVTGVVGVGGMGVVLKAIDPSLDRVVAIKMMAPRLANNEGARKRFAREAKAAAAVMHPNVVPIHSVSSDGPVPYLVMAFNRGSSLQKRIERDAPLQLVEVLRIGSQIAAGLAAAHEQGLVHRDIKPENILIEEGVERVAITDFGLARAVDDNTMTQCGAIAGTPMYMSPEQARGEQVDQQSDLFSLGSVLYALCTGRPPYRADSSYGVMRRIIDELPTPVRDLNPQIPEWFARVVEKLMAKDKADRFASASEVQKLLEACLSHVQQPLSNPLPPSLPDLQSISKRNKSMKLIFGSVTALSLLVALVAGQFIRSQNAAQREKQVFAPLTALDGILDSMMSSTHNLVFLNLGEIGKDNNYLVFTPTKEGVSARFPSYDETSISRRQGKYVARFKQVAESLSLAITEDSDVSSEGDIQGINLKLEIHGEPTKVIATAKQLISRTFQVDESEECSFQYRNMPSESSSIRGKAPQEVTAAAFLAEAKTGNRVYLGEQQSRIYLIPPALKARKQVQLDQDLWYTDLRKLSPEDLDAIRKGTITNPNTLMVESYTVEGSASKGNTQTHRWKMKGKSIGNIEIRVLHIARGMANLVGETVLDGKAEEEQLIDVQLQLQNVDEPTPTHTNTYVPTLAVAVNGLQAKAQTGEKLTLLGDTQATTVTREGVLSPKHVLLNYAPRQPDADFAVTVESMTAASNAGSAFLVVTIDWVQVGQND